MPNSEADSPVYDWARDCKDRLRDAWPFEDPASGIDWDVAFAAPRRRAFAARADLARSGYVITVATHPPKAPATACTAAGSDDDMETLVVRFPKLACLRNGDLSLVHDALCT